MQLSAVFELDLVLAANKPLTGLFIGPRTVKFYLLFLTGPLTSRYQFLKSLLIFIVPLKVIEDL